jgi:hypothetical protein
VRTYRRTTQEEELARLYHIPIQIFLGLRNRLLFLFCRLRWFSSAASFSRPAPGLAPSRNINRLAEAEPLYRRALAIDEKSFGPEHPNVARGLNNLAGLLRATNRLTEAEPLYRQVLRILVGPRTDVIVSWSDQQVGICRPALHTSLARTLLGRHATRPGFSAGDNCLATERVTNADRGLPTERKDAIRTFGAH